jgi:hypothetical protein
VTHDVRTSKWSSNRPGVATSRLTPFPSLSTSALLFAPPITIPNVCEWCAMRSLATPKICRASSRVGEMMMIPVPENARVSAYGRKRTVILPFLGLNFIVCRSSMAGIKNARVFPEPVRAAPSTSFPARRGGIDFSWTGVMVSKPISSRPLIVGSESSSVEKGTRSAMPSCGTAVGAASGPDIEFF